MQRLPKYSGEQVARWVHDLASRCENVRFEFVDCVFQPGGNNVSTLEAVLPDEVVAWGTALESLRAVSQPA